MAKACYAITCGMGILTLILFSCSLSSLHATEVGLKFNKVTKNLDPVPQQSGLHFIGFWSKFITFPNTYLNMQYSTSHHDLLHTRTSDGLPLTLGISFQYTLIVNKVYNLYMSYENDWERVAFNVAADTIADTASKFSAYNFFNDKQTIAFQMQKSLNEYFPENLHMTVQSLQILLVELPHEFEEAILESIAVKQNITRTVKTKDNMMVTFETSIMAAKQSANQTVTLAQGQAKKIMAEQEASATVITQNLQTQSAAYQIVKEKLGLGNDDLMQYIWWDSLTDQQSDSEFIVGLNPQTFIAGQGK